MATKKQKRAAGLAKREAFLKEQRESGLAAQKKARDERVRREEFYAAQAQNIENRLKLLKLLATLSHN